MSASLESVDKALLLEVSELSRGEWFNGCHRNIDRVFSSHFSKEELIDRISWLKDSFYPRSYQKVLQICIRLFKKHIGVIPSYFDEHYHLSVIGIKEIVQQIGSKKGLSFPIYPCNLDTLKSFFASGELFSGFVYVNEVLHYTPIFIQKNETSGKYTLAITDSLGCLYIMDYFFSVLDMSLIEEVFVSSVRRQNDSDSCGIFCIRDFSKWIDHIKSGRSISEVLQPFVGYRSPYYTLVPFKVLGNLPEEFLRSAQSIETASISPDKEATRSYFYAGRGGSLINCKMERYHIKCVAKILKKIF